ncbi:MAG: type II toxin-antitoxin system Phd/YefM family antitoxin [Candidatus Peregrinibacteria bacterium]
MRTITLQNLKSRGSKAIPEGQAVYLIVNSKPKAVLLPPEEYEMLIAAMEELEDIQAIEARRSEKTVRFEKAFPGKRP